LYNYLKFKKSNGKLFFIFLFLLMCAFIYIYIFNGLLEVGETEGFGFHGIIQSDTILFRDIYQNSLLLAYIDANVKNTVIPALLWAFFGGDWYLATLFNIILLFVMANYVIKIASHLNINLKNKYIFCILLLPETFIYTVGILKEIPSLLFFTASAFYYLKRRWIYFIFSVSLLLLFRYQFGVCLSIFLVARIIFGRHNLKFYIVFFILLSSIYPLLIKIVPGLGLDNALIYAEMRNGLGIGSIVESIQFNYYVLSFFATLVKFFQMIIEPWPTPQIFSNSSINIISLAYSVSTFLLAPIWYKYFRFLFHALNNSRLYSQDVHALLCLSISFLIIVSLNGFVHHRYLFPGFALILLISCIPIKSYTNVSA
jgi:hypothetical protein